MALLGRRHVGRHGFLVRLDQRLVNIAQDIADTEASFALVDFRDGLDRFHPARRIRRHIDRLLVIVFDALDRLVQRPVQGRVVAEILANRIVDAIELALDHAFLRLTASSK